jgi:hypothetical protein
MQGSEHYAWKGDEVGFGSLHKRLRKNRGLASQYSCVDCGEPAAQWSYDHTDPNEKIAKAGPHPYSTDPNRYHPRCKSCHKKFDLDYLRNKK